MPINLRSSLSGGHSFEAIASPRVQFSVHVRVHVIGPKQAVVRVESLRGLDLRVLKTGAGDRAVYVANPRYDVPRDLVLHSEKIGGRQRTVEAIGPKMCPGLSIQELRRHAKRATIPPYATFKHVAHTHVASQLLHIDGLLFVPKRNVPRQYKQLPETGELGDDLLGDS